jgi:lipid-binding SYLF domain-containing protein
VSNSAQTIQGITSAITLAFTTTGLSGSGSLQYQKNGGTWTTWSSGTTVSAVNGDAFAFQVTDPNPESEYSGTIHVTNNSDSSTQIAQFTFDVTVNGCIHAC